MTDFRETLINGRIVLVGRSTLDPRYAAAPFGQLDPDPAASRCKAEMGEAFPDLQADWATLGRCSGCNNIWPLEDAAPDAHPCGRMPIASASSPVPGAGSFEFHVAQENAGLSVRVPFERDDG